MLLYYSGHGDEDTGAWITTIEEATVDLDDSLVKIEEILDIF